MLCVVILVGCRHAVTCALSSFEHEGAGPDDLWTKHASLKHLVPNSTSVGLLTCLPNRLHCVWLNHINCQTNKSDKGIYNKTCERLQLTITPCAVTLCFPCCQDKQRAVSSIQKSRWNPLQMVICYDMIFTMLAGCRLPWRFRQISLVTRSIICGIQILEQLGNHEIDILHHSCQQKQN